MIAVIDLETSGLDPVKDRIIEMGAHLVSESWDMVGKSSYLINTPGAEDIPEEISKITHISNNDLKKHGVAFEEALISILNVLGPDIKYIVAYNRKFDEPFLKNKIKSTALSLYPLVNNFVQVPWLCAMEDVPSNYQMKCWKLSHLAVDYGVAVNPEELHRVDGDIQLTHQFLKKIGITADQMYAYQQLPWVVLAATIPAPWTDNGVGVAQAKKLGYSWEVVKGTDKKIDKTWVKRVKISEINNEKSLASFPIREVI